MIRANSSTKFFCCNGAGPIYLASEWPRLGLLNQGFWRICLFFSLRKTAKHRVHSIFLQFGHWIFTESDFFRVDRDPMSFDFLGRRQRRPPKKARIQAYHKKRKERQGSPIKSRDFNRRMSIISQPNRLSLSIVKLLQSGVDIATEIAVIQVAAFSNC